MLQLRAGYPEHQYNSSWLVFQSVVLHLSLAAQDTVKNLFGSLTIFATQPFAVGDWVILANEEGTIEESALRSTVKSRTFEDSIITVPNGKLMDMVI